MIGTRCFPAKTRERVDCVISVLVTMQGCIDQRSENISFLLAKKYLVNKKKPTWFQASRILYEFGMYENTEIKLAIRNLG